MNSGLAVDQGGTAWPPHPPEAQGPNHTVTLSCAAWMTGALAQRELMKRQHLQMFFGGNVLSLLVLKTNPDCHYHPGQLMAISQHFGFLQCQMG